MNRLRRTTVAALVAGASLLAVAGCTIKDDLLEPQQPQVISPTHVHGAVGLYTVRSRLSHYVNRR